MNYIWQVSLISCGYGENGYSESVERGSLFNGDYGKWAINKKRLFSEREDAEDYVRPIVVEAFKSMLSDWFEDAYDNEGNAYDDDEEEEVIERIKIYKERGLQEFRQESLSKDHLYYSSFPRTIFAVPSEYEDDRDGVNFATINRVTVF